MGPILEKSVDSSRSLLFGLLVNCLFPTSKNEDCPIWELRNSLSIEMKHAYVLGLNKEEVARILEQHEECYEKRFSCFWQG